MGGAGFASQYKLKAYDKVCSATYEIQREDNTQQRGKDRLLRMFMLVLFLNK